MASEQPAPGERWITCEAGHVHWGANGAAGLLLRYAPRHGEPRYLLTRRSASVDEGATWGVPGGAIRDQESPEMAAERETIEEVGQLPAFRVSEIEPEDCGGGWCFHVITAEVDRPFEAYCGEETDATGWFSESSVGELPLHPGLRRWWERRTGGSREASG